MSNTVRHGQTWKKPTTILSEYLITSSQKNESTQGRGDSHHAGMRARFAGEDRHAGGHALPVLGNDVSCHVECVVKRTPRQPLLQSLWGGLEVLGALGVSSQSHEVHLWDIVKNE